jgi:hypothetical protein
VPGYGKSAVIHGRLFKATAARMRAFRAAAFSLSPSWKSMARLTLPSRLELKRPEGCFRDARERRAVREEVHGRPGQFELGGRLVMSLKMLTGAGRA